MAELITYTPKDQQKTKELILSVLNDQGFVYSPELDKDLENPEKEYGGHQEIFYILKKNNQVIGTIGIKNRGNGIAELKRMYVGSQFQGQGYGSQLFSSALEFAKKSGYSKIVLDTDNRFSTAQQMYRKKGFKVTKTEGDTIYMEMEI